MKQRTKFNKPDAILTGDWHLREDKPICRTDDFWFSQWLKVDFIAELQRKYDCPIIHAGDLFNHWKPSPYLLSTTIKHLPKQFYTIYGNHDLPYHGMEMAEKSGVFTLYQAGILKVLKECHWGNLPKVGTNIIKAEIGNSNENNWKEIPLIDSIKLPHPIQEKLPLTTDYEGWKILVYHIMTWKSKQPYPDCPDPNAFRLLKKYPQYDLIVTGHNHETFTAEYEGRLLVNPGAITRQTAAQVDHQPTVYLWYAENNTIKPILIHVSKNVISREHIDIKQQHDERIEAFVTRLNQDWNIAISFEENLERFAQANNINESIMEIIYKAIEK